MMNTMNAGSFYVRFDVGRPRDTSDAVTPLVTPGCPG